MTKPSRQFIYRALFLILIITGFVVFQSAWFKKLFNKETNILQSDTKGLAVEKKLNELVDRDSNNNSIADWEESLWGLDPTVAQTNGVLNSDIVAQKRAQAAVNGIDIKNATPGDRLAYDLYTSSGVLAGTDSNGSDPASTTIAQNLSKQLIPAYYPSTYTSDQVKTIKTTSKSVTLYYNNIKALTAKITNTSTGNTEKDLKLTSNSYYQLAGKLIALNVPTTLAQNHLILVNNFAGMGDLLKNVGSENIDQLGVAKNTLTYSQYIKSIDDCVAKIAEIYTNYSIIKQ